MVFVSGMIGWDAQGVFRTTEFAGQVRQALANVVAVLAEAGARPEHIVRMTWYVRDKREYIASYRRDRGRVSCDHRQPFPGDDGRGGRPPSSRTRPRSRSK